MDSLEEFLARSEGGLGGSVAPDSGEAHSSGLVGVAGSRVRLEMRHLREAGFGDDAQREVPGGAGYPAVAEAVGPMAGIARRAEAVAEFLRQLPGTVEGRVMAARLEHAILSTDGDGRDRAGRLLRQAAGWYLDRFPGAGEALEMTLNVVAEGLGVPGQRDAEGLRGGRPVLPGEWAGAADRYERAYEAVHLVARGVALPSAALRRMVSVLALVGGGDAVDYLPDVLDRQDILELLGSIGQSLPAGAVEPTALINDLLLAASLVPAGVPADAAGAAGPFAAGRAGEPGPAGGSAAAYRR